MEWNEACFHFRFSSFHFINKERYHYLKRGYFITFNPVSLEEIMKTTYLF